MVAKVIPFAFDRAEPGPAAHAAAMVATSLGEMELTLHRDFAELRNLWRAFEFKSVCTHAQTYIWSEAWHRLVSAPMGAQAAITVGRNGTGDVAFIWPFEVTISNGLKMLQWIGQEHANYNMGLYDRGFAAKVKADDMRSLLHAAAHLAGDVSLATFIKQPTAWDGADNPMAKLSYQASPSSGYVVTLQPDFEALFNARFGKGTRNSLKRKERKLASYGPVEYGWATSLGERTDMLEIFFAQKSRWFAETGILEAFLPRHRSFYRAMAALDVLEDGQLLPGYTKVNGEVVATFIGVLYKNRFNVLLSSITDDELRRWSPGLLLVRHQIKDLCEQGVAFYDLGVGENRNKSDWADTEISLFDSYIGFDVSGRIAILPVAMRSRVKRFVKNQPQLWTLTQTLRRRLRGHTASQTHTE